MERILFEKYYPRSKDLTDFDQEEYTGIAQQSEPHMSYEEIMAYLQNGLSYQPLPERAEKAKLLIQLAKSISLDYQIDMKIKEYDANIMIDVCLFEGKCIGFLRELFVFADDVNFFTNVLGYDLIISIDYYTKAVLRRGKQIHP